MSAGLDLSRLTIREAAAGLRARRWTSVELVEAALACISRENGRLNAFIRVSEDTARMAAEHADAELREGRDRGPLQGIPIAVKDLIDVAGEPTTAASRVRTHHLAASDAPVIANLRRAGAVLVGKTNLHEFALGTTNEDSAYGPVRHPLDPTRSPGGSSGGSAAALAVGMCLGALGSDTGGSIRIPAAACGLVGLKPAFGEVSCDGVVPLSRLLDHVGPLARTVDDAALLHDALRGETLVGRTVEAHSINERPLHGGVPRFYFLDRLQPEIRRSFEAALKRLQQQGLRIDEVKVPHAPFVPAVYLHLVLAEAAALHAPTLESMPEAYTRPVRVRLELGRYVQAEDYVRALEGRQVIREEVEAALADRDVLLLPTLSIVPPPLGAATVPVDGQEESVRNAMLRLTQVFNLTGHPAISLPIRTVEGSLPCGLQVVARRTQALLSAARWCEGALRA